MDGKNPPERSRDWTYSTHDGEVFLDYKGVQAGVLFIQPDFPVNHVAHVVATLNAYYPTEAATQVPPR